MGALMADSFPSSVSSGITLVLGGGGARGLSHAGVLAVLEAQGIPIKGIVGTSMGAEIGAFYAAGLGTERIQHLVRDLDWMSTVRLFWPSLDGGGLTSGRNILAYLKEQLGDATFADCLPPLLAIATDMRTGEQVILKEGKLIDAVRASIALPGLLSPYPLGNRLLGDGGLVNPLPVGVAREAFGGPVLAVAVHPGAREAPGGATRENGYLQEPLKDTGGPALLENLRRAIQITQAHLVFWHLRASPPDLLIKPVIPGMSSLEFYRGQETLEVGRQEVEAVLPELRELLRQAGPSSGSS